MSIEQQNSNDRNAAAQADRGHPLTASNLALHEQNTPTMPTDRAIHSWLDGNGTSPLVHVDNGTWTRLVDRDLVAAAIDAATRGGGGDQSRGQRKQ
jgi:hypothetical protein